MPDNHTENKLMRLRIVPFTPIWLSLLAILALSLSACTPVEPPIAPVLEEGSDTGAADPVSEAAPGAGEADGPSGVTGAETGILVRGRALFDWDFENRDGAVAGEIEDFFFEMDTGRIPFVTIEYGGVLDIGDTEIAVPLSAFAWGSEDVLVLDLDEQTLANFPDLGDEWPDVTDPAWDDEVITFWNEMGIDPGPNIQETSGLVVEASDLVDVAIVDFGAGGGLIQDLLVDLAEGRVKYLLVGFGASTPVNDPHILPIESFAVEAIGGELLFRGNVDLEKLEAAPRFDLTRAGEMTLMAPEFGAELESYWQPTGE